MLISDFGSVCHPSFDRKCIFPFYGFFAERITQKLKVILPKLAKTTFERVTDNEILKPKGHTSRNGST